MRTVKNCENTELIDTVEHACNVNAKGWVFSVARFRFISTGELSRMQRSEGVVCEMLSCIVEPKRWVNSAPECGRVGLKVV